ncbi:MAG TPA: hypothetical protein PKK10_04190 [Woeseiaceae bacterium]|nr:hypothetical protein [Woeseiaceae bacterium]
MKKLIAILIWLPLFAVADEASVTRHLAEESATIMDIGILRLSLYLEGAMEVTAPDIFAAATNSSEPSVYSSAAYDAHGDFINVTVELVEASNSAPAKAGCLAVLSRLSSLIARVVPDFFVHEGHHHSRKFNDRLVARTAVHCSVSTKESGLAAPVIRLQRALPDGPIVETTWASDDH